MAHEIKLGQLCDEHQQRDAIHIAVAPMQAAEELRPGQHLVLVEGRTDKAAGVSIKTVGQLKAIGIVDPFLNDDVQPGQWFFAFLYQNTVTDMRHHWQHPAFTEERAYVARDPQGESKRWIEDFANTHDVTYNRMMRAADEWIENEEYFVQGGDFEDCSVPEEFWKHYAAITGKVLPDNQYINFFSCSC